MALIVQTYCDAALFDRAGLSRVARRVVDARLAGLDVIVALPAERTSEGDAAGLLSMQLQAHRVAAEIYHFTSVPASARVRTEGEPICASDAAAMRRVLEARRVVIVTELGAGDAGCEGGAEAFGVVLAAAMRADECRIYAGTDGIHTADPDVVPEARRLARVTFEEMLELASLGSPGLAFRAVEHACKSQVSLRMLSDVGEWEEGTLVTFGDSPGMSQPQVSGIAFNRDEAKITLHGVQDKPGIAYQILGPVAAKRIDVDMIIQNVGRDGMTDFSFTVRRADLDRTMAVLEDIRAHVGASSIDGDGTMAKVSVVGVGMRSNPGVASRMFRTLAEEGINIQMISTSEIRISVAIEERFVELAVRALHKAFGLEHVQNSVE